MIPLSKRDLNYIQGLVHHLNQTTSTHDLDVVAEIRDSNADLLGVVGFNGDSDEYEFTPGPRS